MDQDPYLALTWGHLAAWAGKETVSAGIAVYRKKKVCDLTRVGKNGLVAWVYEEEPFATYVWIEDGDMFYQCTCNPANTCEHAVAVVLEYISMIRRNIGIPHARKADERFHLL